MKLIHILAIVTLTSACGTKPQGASLKDDSSKNDLASIGRGSKIVFLKDVEVPANREQATIGPVKYYTWVDEWAGTEVGHYAVCGIYAKEPSLDRRMLLKDSVMEFSGEFTTLPNGENSDLKIEAVGVSAPSAIEGIGCMKMIANCRGRICGEYKQVPMKIKDFEIVFKDIAKLELATPIPIPSN